MTIRVLTPKEFSSEVAAAGNSGIMQFGECYFVSEFETPDSETLEELASLLIDVDSRNTSKIYWSQEDLKLIQDFCKIHLPLRADPLYDSSLDDHEQAYMVKDFLFRCGLNSEIYDIEVSVYNGYWNHQRIRQGQLSCTILKELNLV